MTVLKPVADGPAVVACNSCRADDGSGGADLIAALRCVKARDALYDGVAVDEMPCLFACAFSCAVHLRAPGKIGYVLGRFAAGEEAARAILDYARLQATSEIGEVPYRSWPEGVKGHFLTRTPPAGFVIE